LYVRQDADPTTELRCSALGQCIGDLTDDQLVAMSLLHDRLDAHARTSEALAKLTDAQLQSLLSAATPLGTGIGGTAAAMEVDGAQVFVKTVRLTDLERTAQNVQSTTNMFDLPLNYQYGLSSAGFGAWRELAAHQLTTHWVVSGACESFPLLHHWAVLPRSPVASADLERQVAAWNGSPRIRARLTAMERASASIVLFLERMPQDLVTFLAEGEPVPHWVEADLLALTAFLRERHFVHFDAHFGNILTDGRQLYLSDFGQALSSTFTLSPDEAAFLEAHRDFDRSYVAMKLFAVTKDPRYAELADVMKGFFARLGEGDRTAPLPESELAQASAFMTNRSSALAGSGSLRD
jgi:hypothetical protein